MRISDWSSDVCSSDLKGYGLGAMVEILCSTLTGSWLAAVDPATGKAGNQNDIGHFFLALDPDLVREEGEFADDMDRLLDMLRATPPADPAQPVDRKSVG